MNIFLKVINDRIVELNDVEFPEFTKVIKINNSNDFFDQTKDYFIDEELELKLTDLVSEIETNDVVDFQSYTIKHWVSNRSFGELIDMYISGEILKPRMQREFVWDSLKCSRLIESIVLGLPIPPLFLLEIDKNQYEIIDGFQRIDTLVKFSEGLPWNTNLNDFKNVENESIDIEKAKKENARPSKLSKSVVKEIAGKNFNNLSNEHQRILRRSTIPLIEFNQVSPDNFDSKYLIFERINTGSEKLNPMQIRKSLAYGNFIEDLYRNAENSEKFKSIFSNGSLKKDSHVEAYLRIYVMSKIVQNEYKPNNSGIKNILNDFCEKHKDTQIEKDFHENFLEALEIVFKTFDNKSDIFKRIDLSSKRNFTGNLNVSIMESFMGTIIINTKKSLPVKSAEELLISYKEVLYEVAVDAILEEDYTINPFSYSTGTIASIKKRFEIFNSIVSV